MAKQKTGTKPDEVLRARAKKFLVKPGPDLGNIPSTDIQKLVHELQIHQVELDMQNEELRRAQGEAEAAGAKYADLFDFAPIGYFIFNRQGLILDANLTGAGLLGVERGSLLHTPFLSHVVPAFRPEFTAHLQKVFVTQARQSCTLQLATQAGAVLQVAMESIAFEAPGSGLPQCRSAFSDITARQLAEADLRRSEEKFHLLFDQAPLGYQSLDEEGHILEVNQTWLDLLGYSREEVLGRGFSTFLKPADQDLFTERFARIKAAGRSAASSGRWCARTAPPSSPPLPARSFSTNRENFCGLIVCLRTSPPGSWRRKPSKPPKPVTGPSSTTSTMPYLSTMRLPAPSWTSIAKWRRCTATPPQEARNLRVEQISSGQPPYTQDYALTRIRQAAAGEPQLFEWLCKDKNGRLFWVEVSLNRAVIGGQERVLAIVRDNTARKQAEEEINTTVAFLENIIASSVDPIAIVDQHGRFTRWNQAAAEAYGYSAEGLANQTAFDLYADKQALGTMLSQLRRDGFVRGYEIDMRKKDGTIAPFSLSIGLLGDEDGKSTGSVCVARDLSETRKSLAVLSLMNGRLQDLVEEAERRNHELTLINSMAEKLQSCLSRTKLILLLPSMPKPYSRPGQGPCSSMDPTNNLMEAVSTWGDARGRGTGLSPH